MDEETGIVRPLEEPFIEVVVGTERVAMLSQGRESVFEIDSIAPLIKHVHQSMKTSIPAIVDQVKNERILVDHLRAFLFLTADGAPSPGRGGRARLMRKLARGMITSQKLLQIEDPGFVASLLDLALDLYADQQPQLPPARQELLSYLADERTLFEKTLRRGKRRLERILKQQDNNISGEDIVRLEKHHGLPQPLIEVFLTRKQIPFSRQAYQNAYKEWYQSVIS
jgi:alanyl-tRNA synthetase